MAESLESSPGESYEQIVQGLRKLGVAGLPAVDLGCLDKSWRTTDEQFNVLKTIEFLISQRKRILADTARKTGNRVDPLSSRIRSQQKQVSALSQQATELNHEIELANERLRACKAQRAEQQQIQTQELKEIEIHIADLLHSAPQRNPTE
jgi:SMC interacting uncharacterized protein involved in chromosome segregation